METEPAILSFAELRERHLDLLREWNAAAEASLSAEAEAAGEASLVADAAEASLSAVASGEGGSAEAAASGKGANGRLPLAPAAEALRASAAALGGWLDDAEERDRAQGMIDYWTSALASLPGRQFPELIYLAAFDPALPAAAVVEAEAIFAGHEGTPRAADAEAMLSCLVRPGAGDTIVCRPPVERVDLEHADGVTDQTASQGELLDALVAAGLIRRQDGETAAQDRFDFTHGSVARAWPRLRALLDKRRNANETRDKLRATAQLWQDSNHDRGVLLTGPALDDAVRYLGDDKVLDEFIRASRASEERAKKFRLILVTAGTTALLVLLAVMAVAGYSFGNSFGFDRGKSSGLVAGAEIGATIESEAPDAVATIRAENLDRITPERQPDLPPGGPGIHGWIWVGDGELRLLRWLESRQPVDPAEIRPGLAYRTRTRVRLRADAPARNAGPGGDRGLMPAGALVLATGAPVTVRRAAGPQYWLPVTLVPRLRVHFTEAAARPLADQLAGRLREAGFDVEPPGESEGEGLTSLLNYFRKDDARIAADAARLVGVALRRPDGTPPEFRCELVSNANFGTGSLDLTLDFTGLSLRQRGDRRPVADAPPPCR